MTVADIPAGLDLCRASGWNQTEADWRHFLAAAPRGVLVAVERGAVIGTVAALPYGPFAWIAMILVTPAARGRGVGTRLLEEGLALVPDGVTVRLDATPAGEPIYRRLGFAAEYGITRVFLDGLDSRSASPRTSAARPLTAADWPAVLEKDEQVFGGTRVSLLERLAAEAPEYAWVVERDRRLEGYLFGRHGHARDHLGPIVAGSTETAGALVHACLSAHPGRRFFIDAPDRQQAWRAELGRLGFAAERPFLRMNRGALTAPGQPSQVFAITGAEFG